MSQLVAFRAVAAADLRKLFRTPSFIVPTVVFPVLFFAMFGLANASRTINGVKLGAYILASYGAYATMAVALTSFAVSIATERGLGWNRLLRVTPLPTLVYFAAKISTAIAIGALALVALFAFGASVGGVHLAPMVWLQLVAVLLVGMLPFALLGLAIGYISGPTAAAPISNLIFLPLSFASGFFLPLAMLPASMQKIAPWLPSYHLGQLAWSVIGAGDDKGMPAHAAWLAAYATVFAILGWLAFRRDEGKTFT